jgi:predicted dehydrogenase
MKNEITSSPQHLRVAVAGAGRMGLRHLLAVRELGMQAVGVADLAPTAVQAACEAHGIPRASGFTDALQMIDRLRPQALVIATTAPSHAELVLAAAASGVKHILCEKPMACSLAQADAMLEACEAHGTMLAVNHQMRFMPQYTQVKALLGGEELGALSSIVVAGSNFGLAMNASHYFEMFRWISGQPVHSLQAWFDEQLLPNPRGAHFEDRSGRLLARNADGVHLYLDFAVGSGHGLQVTYVCSNGQVMVDELSGDMRISARQAEYRALPTTRYGMPAEVRHETIEPADAVAPTVRVWRAMLAGSGFPDGQAGLHALRCLVAAHASHEAGGRPVGLDDALPRERMFPWA